MAKKKKIDQPKSFIFFFFTHYGAITVKSEWKEFGWLILDDIFHNDV